MAKEKDYREILNERLQDPAFKAEWDAVALERQTSCAIINAREEAHLSLEQLAALTGIKESMIRRYESGSGLPSLKTLDRLAQAMGLRIQIRFVSPEEADGLA
ncbi:MAG: helix-turn-helix domain-containing protein [Clostridia bacterium]|nr:helix-turn-helix domain-containing protein [Clostridia bacterium]